MHYFSRHAWEGCAHHLAGDRGALALLPSLRPCLLLLFLLVKGICDDFFKQPLGLCQQVLAPLVEALQRRVMSANCSSVCRKPGPEQAQEIPSRIV
jgi:hypothetical protein